jgi:hypothetical protein
MGGVSMANAARHGERPDGSRSDRGLYAVPGVEPRIENELQAGLDSVVAFADFCLFLAGDAADERARELARLAEDLYGETVALLRGALPGQ